MYHPYCLFQWASLLFCVVVLYMLPTANFVTGDTFPGAINEMSTFLIFLIGKEKG